MANLRSLAAIVWLCLLTGGVLGGRQADLRDYVLNSIRHNESLFKNFEVKFTVRWYDAEGKPNKPPGDRDFVTEERWHYAREANKIYGAFSTDWSNNSTTAGKQVFDGARMKYYREDLHNGMISSRRQLPTSAVPDRFTNWYRNVGDLTMSEFLEAGIIKRISPCDVNGAQGFMVETVHKGSTEEDPLEQKIYFDAEKGFVPVRVETYHVLVSRDQPTLVAEVQGFERVSDDIYFPKKARLVRYTLEGEQQGSPGRWKVETEIRVEVSDIRVNTELPKDMFELEYPIGTHIYDETLDLAYRKGVTPKSLAMMEEVVAAEAGNLSDRGIDIEQVSTGEAPGGNQDRTAPAEDRNRRVGDVPSQAWFKGVLGSASFWISVLLAASGVICLGTVMKRKGAGR